MSSKNKKGEVNEPLEHYQKPLTFENVWQLFQETDKRFQETDKKFQENAARIKELNNLFTSQWGRLIESLVEGDIVRLLNERNIPVERTLQRISGNYRGTSYEFDIVAVNGEEVVIIEVKTTLRPSDVKDFMSRLAMAKTWLREYRDSRLYGAIAYLRADAGSKKMAENHGLFVIRATGNSAAIVNTPGFRPKLF